MTGTARLAAVALAASTVLLGGCSAIGGFVGAVAAIATGAGTANPVVGVSVGIAVKAATDQALQSLARRNQRHEHEAIVAVVADLAPGQSGRWEREHFIGSGMDRGEVRVVRLIETPLATCKEILFSVEHGGANPRADWFTTTACRSENNVWRWAAAEPAVDRWGNLQ